MHSLLLVRSRKVCCFMDGRIWTPATRQTGIITNTEIKNVHNPSPFPVGRSVGSLVGRSGKNKNNGCCYYYNTTYGCGAGLCVYLPFFPHGPTKQTAATNYDRDTYCMYLPHDRQQNIFYPCCGPVLSSECPSSKIVYSYDQIPNFAHITRSYLTLLTIAKSR